MGEGGRVPGALSNPLPFRKLQMCCTVRLKRDVKDCKASLLLFLCFVHLHILTLYSSDSVCGQSLVKFDSCPNPYC